ncbi:unnamed protein product [Closterium sp. NIES-65]|nr:unnamed protein product [Closterium sp. NIES-65]
MIHVFKFDPDYLANEQRYKEIKAEILMCPLPPFHVFKFDPDYLANEQRYKEIKAEILGDEEEEEDDKGEKGDDDEEEEEDEESSEEEEDEEEQAKQQEICDETETNLVNLRRTIYLTIMASVNFEEAGHKLMKVNLQPGQEMELCEMLLACCSQERTYLRYYGLLGQRFCMLNRAYQECFEQCFVKQYSMIHRLETNKLRNVAKLFAHFLATDAMPWALLSYIRLTEEDTSSSSRIFIKIMFQWALFAHFLATDAMPWALLSYIRLTEEDTSSSSRIFIKIMFQASMRSQAHRLFAHFLATDAMPWALLSYIRLTEENTSSSSRIFFRIMFQLQAVPWEWKTRKKQAYYIMTTCQGAVLKDFHASLSLETSMPILTRATKAAATMTTQEGQTSPPLEQTAGTDADAGTRVTPPADGRVAPVVATASTSSAPPSASPVPDPVAPAPAASSAYASAGGDEEDEDDDDGYLSDDPEEGIEVQIKGALAAKARVTLTLLIPFELAKEMAAVKPSVKALLIFLKQKKLSDKALDDVAFQELLPTFISKIHFSRLQVTLATVEDAEVVRQHRVEHIVGTTKHQFGWLHPVNRAYVNAKSDLPEGVEVLLKGVPAEITPLIVYESLVVAKLQKRGRSAFLQGAGFHRVVDPVSGLDTDKIRGLVVPHPGDMYRWRHVVEDPLTASIQSAGVVRKILRDPALVLISTEANVEEWLCVQECCERAHGDSFAQAVAHIGSFSHGAALGSAGVATRATKAKQSLRAAKKLYGIRAEKAKGK